MIFTLTFFIVLLTGGNLVSSVSADIRDDQFMSNQSFNMPVGNAKKYEASNFFNLTSDQISDDKGEMPYMPEYSIFNNVRVSLVEEKEQCSFQDILIHLNLTQNNDKYTLSRPVKCPSNLTWVYLEMKLYAILDVRERDQTFIAYVWIYMRWDNEHIWWNPEEFCETKHILVPTNLLWMPDLTIEEMTEKDKASPSPYVIIRNHGWVEYRNDKVVISTCQMHVYKFPFDIQSCQLSFKSIMHSDKEIKLFYHTTEWTRLLETQYEWLIVNVTVANKTVTDFEVNQTVIVYTINMKRNSVLYIANFLLPVFFFLCLDFTSLLMSDTSGEKVGFKITVLLAVTVMQLILNDILPSASDQIPLIAVYCIGTFALMLLSLLETILVIHLIDKDASQDNEMKKSNCMIEGQEEKLTNSKNCFTGIKKCTNRASVNNTSAERTPTIGKEGNEERLTEVSLTLERMSDELEEIKKSIILSGRQKDEEPGYWTRTAQKINKIFAVFYVIVTILFLSVLSIMWCSPDY